MRWREVARKLEAAGFTRIHQRGSHIKFRRYAGRTRVVILPRDKDVPAGTLGNILRQAELTPREFEDL